MFKFRGQFGPRGLLAKAGSYGSAGGRAGGPASAPVLWGGPTVFGAASGAGVAAVSLTYPAGVLAGDVGVVLLADVNSAGAGGISLPAGYTLRANETTSAGHVQVSGYTKALGGTEGGTALSLADGAGDDLAATLLVLRGCASAVPDVTATTGANAGGPLSATTGSANCLLVAAWGLLGRASTFADPFAWLRLSLLTGPAFGRGGVDVSQQVGAGAGGNIALTTNSAEYGGVLLAMH